MIKNRPEGSNITVFNTLYQYPKKLDNGKWTKDTMDIIYKDLDTNEKYHETIVNPDYEFYKLKDVESLDYNAIYMEIEKCDKHVVPFKDLEREIAKVTDNVDFYKSNLSNGLRRENKKLHTDTSLFDSDCQIEDHYRYRFNKMYKNEPYNPTKAYFDIEVDAIDCKGDFPEPGECPVNAITIINDVDNTMYTFLLRNKENPMIEEFEHSLRTGFFQKIKDTVLDAVGGWKNLNRYKLDDLKYEILMYDEEEEINLIADFFNLINKTKPDFVLAWNMAFDMPYLIERIRILGYSPEDIICHPDFTNKICRYNIDTNPNSAQEYHKRGDKADVSSYSYYLCQMIQFASRRAGQAAYKIVNLDRIGHMITKIRKLDYSLYSPSIVKLPYCNYEVFVLYNIVDTLIQKCIESKVSDMDYIFTKCVLNNTRFDKVHRQTVYLVNGARDGFYKEGLVIGNNVNKFKEKPLEKYPGAYVAHSRKLNDYSKMQINGLPIQTFNNLDDFDYKALYPSIDRQNNIAPSTIIAKIVIEQQIYLNEDPFNYKFFDRGAKFCEDLHSHNYITFCNRWMGLANYKELYQDVIDYFTSVRVFKKPLNVFDNNGLKNPFVKVPEQGFEPFVKVEGLKNPFYRYVKKPDNFYDTCKGVDINKFVYNTELNEGEEEDE